MSASSSAGAPRCPKNAHPNVLVCDISMPEIAGFQLIREARRRIFDDEQIPANACTAFARPEDRQTALRNGHHARVPKLIERVDSAARILVLLR